VALMVLFRLVLALALAGPPGSGEPGSAPASFTVRIVSSQPLFLVGHCKIRAEAIDAEGGPYERVAWMALSVDGKALAPDSEPPFEWEFDAGADLRPRRLQIEAVARDGAKASLALLSSAYAFAEAVGVNLVLVPVVVRQTREGGASGPTLRGLTSADFTVLEDGSPRPITSFSDEPLPASIGVALDNSVSMERDLRSAVKAVIGFVESQPTYSALSFLTFNDQVYLEHDFTYDARKIASAVGAARVEGTRTALFDALRIGSMHLSRRPGARVLVVFTDGEDTVYEGDEGRLRTSIDAAQGADVTVFAVAYGLRQAPSLSEMTSRTGGEVIAARSAGDLKEAFARIAESLGSRYLLGYEPPEPQKPGYRNIEVRVSRPGVIVLARRGYRMR
jgi:VWFA-related protein